MNFCSNCGSDQIPSVIPEGDNRPRFVCQKCDEIHYQNPRIIVGALPVWEDRVLLCKRAIEPRVGYWNVPGGFMENGETSEEGAAREVVEESGATVLIDSLLSVYNIPHVNQVYLHYLGVMKSDYFENGEESLETQFFTEDEIPWKEMAFTSSKFCLRAYFENRKTEAKKVHHGTFIWPPKS